MCEKLTKVVYIFRLSQGLLIRWWFFFLGGGFLFCNV